MFILKKRRKKNHERQYITGFVTLSSALYQTRQGEITKLVLPYKIPLLAFANSYFENTNESQRVSIYSSLLRPVESMFHMNVDILYNMVLVGLQYYTFFWE